MPDFPMNNSDPSAERRGYGRRWTDRPHDPMVHLLDQIPIGVMCFDREWRVTYANPEACRICRITPADFNRRTQWELFPATIGSELEESYRAAMDRGISSHFEYHYPPYDKWVDIHVFPAEDGIATYYRDISELKRAQALRDISIYQLEQISEATDDSIVCIDRNWNCTFANRAARKILKANDLIGANLWTRFPMNTLEPFASNYRATMERRITTEFEAYYPHPLDIWFKVLARPYEDGIIIFSSDITDLKGAEFLRDASVRQLQQVLEATTDAVVSLNRDSNFTFLNRRAKELLAIKGDLLGKNLWAEFPAANVTGGYRYHFDRAMNEGIAGEFEEFYPDPLNLWLSIQMRPSDDGVVIFFRDVTARKKSDAVLAQQQEILSAVQQTARVATWEVDVASGNIVFGRDSYPVFGHPLASIPNLEAFTKFVLPEYVPVVGNLIQKTIETGEMIVVDFPLIAHDGSLLWVENRGQAVRLEDGTLRLVGLSIDITARKRNEQALVASEARYRVLADLNPQAIWMGDPDGTITYANQGFLDYIGLTIETIGGMGWLHAFAPADRTRVVEAWQRSVATGADYDVEARLIRSRDGHSRWWWVRAQPVRDQSGNILHWLGIGIDIHDRKTFAETLQQRQEETERQRAELETIYETAPVGLALFDPVDFRYLRVNTRQAETIGLPKDQIIGRRIAEIAPLEGLQEIFQQVAAGHPIRNHLIEGELPTRPGELRSWNVSYSPIFSADNKVEAIAAVILEITNQKKAEAALIQSEKLAAVGRLASSISHEINNPLEAITNLLYLMSMSSHVPDDLAEYIKIAQSELSRVCQIATQTLRFHRQAVRATHVTAEDLVGAVLNLYQGRLANSSIHVEATYETTTSILCFENDIRQVLNNLIANAIDAMRQGGRLVVRAHDATDFTTNRKGIRITIADTGHGMSPAIRARIFEPFYTTKELNGTGLGLWISKGIVSRHYGRLTLRSSEHPIHHGSIFTLFLPLKEPAEG